MKRCEEWRVASHDHTRLPCLAGAGFDCGSRQEVPDFRLRLTWKTARCHYVATSFLYVFVFKILGYVLKTAWSQDISRPYLHQNLKQQIVWTRYYLDSLDAHIYQNIDGRVQPCSCAPSLEPAIWIHARCRLESLPGATMSRLCYHCLWQPGNVSKIGERIRSGTSEYTYTNATNHMLGYVEMLLVITWFVLLRITSPNLKFVHMLVPYVGSIC